MIRAYDNVSQSIGSEDLRWGLGVYRIQLDVFNIFNVCLYRSSNGFRFLVQLKRYGRTKLATMG